MRNEVNIKLLQCMVAIDLSNSSATCNNDRLLEFVKFYYTDFPQYYIWLLNYQCESFYEDVSTNAHFTFIKRIVDNTKKWLSL